MNAKAREYCHLQRQCFLSISGWDCEVVAQGLDCRLDEPIAAGELAPVLIGVLTPLSDTRPEQISAKVTYAGDENRDNDTATRFLP